MTSVTPKSASDCRTLVELLRYRAAVDSTRAAYSLIDEDDTITTLTYGELDERARALAAHLQVDGIEGQRVVLLYRPGLEYIVALFGCLYAGSVPIPTHPPRPHRPVVGLQMIIRDAGATVALAPPAVASAVQERLALGDGADRLTWRAVEAAPASLAADWREPACSHESLAFLQYTSGSTSAPKAVMVTHDAVLQNLDVIRRNFSLLREDIGVFWLPPYHDMGLVGAILAPLFKSVHSYLMAPASFLRQPARWLQAIAQVGGTISGAPNFAYALAVQRVSLEQRERLDLSRWRLAFCGGEPIRYSTLDAFARTFATCGFRREALYPCYGLAESTLMVSGDVSPVPLIVERVNRQALASNRVAPPVDTDDDPQVLVGCGQAAPGHTVTIVNPITCRGCDPEEVGEIWVAGPSVAKGYWQRPTETRATFTAYRADTGEGPFLRTGDLGFLRGAALFVTGRLKDLIIIRGRNHYPQDIEATVAAVHPALPPVAGAAFAVEAEDEERLIVVHEIDRRLPVSALEDVVTTIRRSVSEHHDLQPHAVVLVKIGGVPKTSSGKVKRSACRAAFLAGELSTLHEFRAAPGMPVGHAGGSRVAVPEDAFADLPAVLRECERIEPRHRQERLLAYFRNAATHVPALHAAQLADLQQPLTDLGLDSLTMVEFAQALGHTLGRPMPPTLLFDYATLDALTRFLLNDSGPYQDVGPPVESDARDARVRQLAASSESDVEALLMQKLKTLEAGSRRAERE